MAGVMYRSESDRRTMQRYIWMDGPRVYAQGTEVGAYLRNDIPLTMVVQRTYVQ